MEEIISKNILIIGPQRCGKSSITNYISKKYQNYEPLRGDPLEVAFQSNSFVSDNDLPYYLKEWYEQTKIDLDPINRKIVMDTISLEPKEAKERFGGDCDIYCLGMPNETVDNLVKTIRKKETPYDWTYYLGVYRLEVVCRHIIEKSKQLQQECEEYNIKFFDTSGNREEKLEKAIKEIEESSINC